MPTVQTLLKKIGVPKNTSPAALTKAAKRWFQEKTFRSVINDRKLTNNPELGKMYLFVYDAKHKDKLPYWDKHPLIIVIKKSRNHVLGLNLHYLPPVARLKFLAQLTEYASNRNLTEDTRLRVTYSFLKSASKLKMFRPTIHKYLVSHTKSQFALIPADEWKYVVPLPLAKWTGASSSTVYTHSKEMY